MITVSSILSDTETKMHKALEVMQREFMGIRTGRASSALVDHIKVDYYGAQTPLIQLANIGTPEPRLIVIQPWDVSAIKAIEKAINESNLGISPIVEGKVIRIPIPQLTKERREELVKVVKGVAEKVRVSVRTIRRDANEHVKQNEKEKKITEDESFKAAAEIQKLTDRYIHLIDEAEKAKEKDLTQL